MLVRLKYCGIDNWGRLCYENENGRICKLVNDEYYTVTRDGEPSSPLRSECRFEFVDTKPHYISTNRDNTAITIEYLGKEIRTAFNCKDGTDYTLAGTFEIDGKVYELIQELFHDDLYGTCLSNEIKELINDNHIKLRRNTSIT